MIISVDSGIARFLIAVGAIALVATLVLALVDFENWIAVLGYVGAVMLIFGAQGAARLQPEGAWEREQCVQSYIVGMLSLLGLAGGVALIATAGPDGHQLGSGVMFIGLALLGFVAAIALNRDGRGLEPFVWRR